MGTEGSRSSKKTQGYKETVTREEVPSIEKRQQKEEVEDIRP